MGFQPSEGLPPFSRADSDPLSGPGRRGMLHFVRPSVPQSLNRQYRGGGLGPAGLRGARAGGAESLPSGSSSPSAVQVGAGAE